MSVFYLSSGEDKENIPKNCSPPAHPCDVFPYTLQQ